MNLKSTLVSFDWLIYFIPILKSALILLIDFMSLQADTDERMKRIQASAGVQGIVIVNHEGKSEVYHSGGTMSTIL